jgi:hypothetical protein
VILEHLGDRDPELLSDTANGVTWLLGRAVAASIDRFEFSDRPVSPRAVVTDLLDRLSRAPGATVGAIVAVSPSTHAPGWQCWWREVTGIRVVENARMSAEHFEDLVETRADVVLRVPEVGLSLPKMLGQHAPKRRVLPAGYAAFVFRMRSSGSAQDGSPEASLGGRALTAKT